MVAPAFMLTSGMLLGTAFSWIPLKVPKNRVLLMGIFAVITAIVIIFSTLLLQDSLASIYLFNSFIATVNMLPYNNIGGSIYMIAAIILVGIFEVGFTSGFTIATKISKPLGKKELSTSQRMHSSKAPVEVMSTANTSDLTKKTVPTELKSVFDLSKDATEMAEEQGLHRDEQGIMELFLYGKVTEIIPVVDTAKSGGYYFKGMPQLGWDTKRSRQVLDSLVRKGFLKAELTDKMIICKTCGSANVRLKRTCPECNSLKLNKQSLIEHFTCGAVEKQDAFETESGDLVCPKCNAKLQLIGSDYRKLPPAYHCNECNTLSSEPLVVAKCRDCDAITDMHDEPEVFLYSYSVNPGLPLKEMQQIKPIEMCIKFFKSLGYTIVAPALVSGKSGTQHLFDLLILGRVGWVGEHNIPNTTTRKDNGNTVVQLLISSKPIDIEEITRMYGMINDVDCDAINFIIPSLTESARNYAAAYNMKISEGQTIEEALVKSKIPKATEDRTGA